ncbi:MAG: uncharacterized membrane protein (UPF0127 family) [Myxococcota bacterium]|jgi:uncharacterized membrane protein (UPF0127 family)
MILGALGCDADRTCEATVNLATVTGGTATICAAIADDAPSRVRGLIGSEPLGPDEGLLLDFPAEDRVCITNEQVDFAIEAVFIGDGRAVVAIETFVARQPGLTCHDGTRYVLETAKGAVGEVEIGSNVTISR